MLLFEITKRKEKKPVSKDSPAADVGIEAQLVALVPHLRRRRDQAPAVGRVPGGVPGVGGVPVAQEVEEEHRPDHEERQEPEGLEVEGLHEALDVEAEGPQSLVHLVHERPEGGGGGGGGGHGGAGERSC